MEDKSQSDAYRSAWLQAERELEIQGFLSVPATWWWQVGEPSMHDDGVPPARERPVPEPVPSSPDK